MRRAILIGAGLLLLPPLALVFFPRLPLPQVDDIAFLRVDLVQASDVPKQDRNPVDRGREGPFLRVTITSSHDFQKLAYDWHYTIGWHASPCSKGDYDGTKPMDGYYPLYDSHGQVFMYDQRPTFGGDPLYRYHFYLAVKAETNLDLPADERQYAYDLKAHPQDICFGLGGIQEVDGDNWGFAQFKSNAARIGKEAIARALH